MEALWFESVWDYKTLKNNSTTNDNKSAPLSLPFKGLYDCVVMWGKAYWKEYEVYTGQAPKTGVQQTYYKRNENIVVRVMGRMGGFAFEDGFPACRTALMDIRQFGCLRLGNSGAHFQGCSGLTGFSAKDAPDLTGVSTLARTFQRASLFQDAKLSVMTWLARCT